jgi:ElaA protein
VSTGPGPWRWTWARFEGLSRDDLYDALALRCRVFILEQGAFQDPDGLDRHAWHLLGRDADGEARLYLRVVDPGHKYDEPSIGRVVVDATVRGTGAGRLLMTEGLARCDAVWPTHPNRISAQAHLQRFYGSLGYRPVGEPYGEDGIPHQQMLRDAPSHEGDPT